MSFFLVKIDFSLSCGGGERFPPLFPVDLPSSPHPLLNLGEKGLLPIRRPLNPFSSFIKDFFF